MQGARPATLQCMSDVSTAVHGAQIDVFFLGLVSTVCVAPRLDWGAQRRSPLTRTVCARALVGLMRLFYVGILCGYGVAFDRRVS